MSVKPIAVKVMLVSRDTTTADILCQRMEQMAVHVEVCADIDSAAGKLCHAKFEAVMIDFDDSAKALELVRKTHEMTSHKKAVVVAILNGSDEMPGAFRAGASFALVKPLRPEILSHTLKASYPLMVREMRRYYRHSFQIPVRIATAQRTDFVAETVNMSEGGMAILSPLPMQVGESVSIHLVLPGLQCEMQISATVCWTREEGRVGLEFVQVPATESAGLQSWLSDRLEESLSR